MNQIKQQLSIIFSLICIFTFFSNQFVCGQKQSITIQGEQITIRHAFDEIERQSSYTVAYGQSVLDVDQCLSLSLYRATVDEALEQILKGRGLTFRLSGNHIILQPDHEATARQRPTQTIRGIVVDAHTGVPISYASVGLEDAPQFGTSTDSLGRFEIRQVPVGRYRVKVSYLGYTSKIVAQELLSSSREAYLVVSLQENVQELSEIVVRPQLNKHTPVNTMSISGGRLLSMEEASRFANGFDDPARLVSTFAGVAGNPGSNAIAIRGNSPQFTQWRLEGVEIPNPTHFSDLTGVGGGFLSGLSTHVTDNSDFFNGAFPAEYNNALAGVFDIKMRNGNNRRYQHTVQMGILGIDLASEGPFSRKRGSSYLFNYRFSNTSLASKDNLALKYQDLSFKLHFPTSNAGVFSLWGLSLVDKNNDEMKEDRSEWETAGDRQAQENRLEKVAGGLSHRYNLNNNMYVNSSLAATYSNDHTFVDQLSWANNVMRVGDFQNRRWDMVFSTNLNTRFSSYHVNRTGLSITGLSYDLDYRVSPDRGLDVPMEIVSVGEGNSSVWSAYTTSKIDLTAKWSATVGVNFQYFNLNGNVTLEPRLALKWKLHQQHSLSVAYGLHSRREKVDYYFVTKNVNGEQKSNKYLDFSKSHHFGLTYDWNISSGLHLKVEPYYQFLFDIPVEDGSAFSIINHDDFYLDRILVNNGAGRNYGLDFTLEQYLDRGFYYMLTASLFSSKYKGGDGVWRSTRLDRRFLANVATGREWMVGKYKQNVLNVNIRLFAHGGDCHSPIDEAETYKRKQIEFDESRAYSQRFKPAFNGDISVSFRINRKKLSHEFSLKMLNAGWYTGAHYYEFNETRNEIVRKKAYGMIPNISYKIQF